MARARREQRHIPGSNSRRGRGAPTRCASIARRSASQCLGDAVLGDGAGTLMLLARALSLALSPPVSAVAPPPAHMREALLACGWDDAV